MGGGSTLGQRGYVKVTYINRRASNFVEDFIDLDGGSTEIINDGMSYFVPVDRTMWWTTTEPHLGGASH